MLTHESLYVSVKVRLSFNAAMLKINHELGFKPYLSRCVWQVETEKVLEYLGQK